MSRLWTPRKSQTFGLLYPDFKPKKPLGQYFLWQKNALKKIIEAASLCPEDTVLEIGPGTGILTQELAKRAKKVIAVEKDKELIPLLKDNLKSFTNIEIVQGDILKIWDLSADWRIDWKLIANLPYYIATAIIRKALEFQKPPKLMVLMVQKEVGQRICAKPPKMSLLAVSVQFYAKAQIIGYVKKTAFWPKPKVDSAILKIAPLIDADKKRIYAHTFFKIVKAGFSQPRKTLLNNLSSKLGLPLPKEKVKIWLLNNKINPISRAESLRLEDWLNLAKTF